ncbi:fatty acid desaturase [Albirhodobacter sp. R86504]|uniref:alkane 1-monooxygenase n=1 Tax=Albirhodobacter sp. R86504 TaxID=3093848 RepID=UPI00366F590A
MSEAIENAVRAALRESEPRNGAPKTGASQSPLSAPVAPSPRSAQSVSKTATLSSTASPSPKPSLASQPSPSAAPAHNKRSDRVKSAFQSLAADHGGKATPAAKPSAPVAFFALATLAPLALLALAAMFGGVFAIAALLYVTVLSALFDELASRAYPDAPEGAEFPAADRLLVAIGIAHFAALALAIVAISGGTGLSFGAKLAVFLGFGLFFGQVSNSTAHELIHSKNRRLFALGKWIYISLLFGHHTSAHRLVHHRFVATPYDPNTADLGESFYAFFPRAWADSFVSGYEMEEARTQKRKDAGKRAVHPYFVYILGSFAIIVIVFSLTGFLGLLAYLALAFYAQVQLMLSDYVQHYGLERAPIGPNTYEPVNASHSWDARAPLSSLWMMNAPRHSDHHANPNRAYPALRLGEIDSTRAILPRSLPVMATLALMPTLWRKVMDKRVIALRAARQAAAETVSKGVPPAPETAAPHRA